jgi:hypothetical protein
MRDFQMWSFERLFPVKRLDSACTPALSIKISGNIKRRGFQGIVE